MSFINNQSFFLGGGGGGMNPMNPSKMSCSKILLGVNQLNYKTLGNEGMSLKKEKCGRLLKG